MQVRAVATPRQGQQAGAPGERLAGIELARSLALIGMLAVHLSPPVDPSLAGRLYGLPLGRASVLFMLLAGIGVSLLAASRSLSLSGARLKLAWRAALLLPLGLALQGLDHGVNVILQVYALLFVVAIFALRLSDRGLLLGAAAAALLGPLAYLGPQLAAGSAFAAAPPTWGDPLPALLHGLLLSGPYPLVVWAAPFLLGIWLGRRDLAAARVRVALAVGGALLAVSALLLGKLLSGPLGVPTAALGWGQLAQTAPHSQMPLWLLSSIGSALLVLGLALVVADRLARGLRPLVVLGQLVLTVYVAHLLLLHAWPQTFSPGSVAEAVLLLAAIAAAAATLAVGWRALLPRGPLETLLNPPAWLQARLERPAAARPQVRAERLRFPARRQIR